MKTKLALIAVGALIALGGPALAENNKVERDRAQLQRDKEKLRADKRKARADKRKLRADQAEVMAVPRAQHQPMLAERNRRRVAIGGSVADGEEFHV